MTETEQTGAGADRKPSRAGGRAARITMRAAPLAENMRSVRGGMEGGVFGLSAPKTNAGFTKRR